MSVIVTPLGRRSATSPSSRKMTWSVWARIAATSLARNDLAVGQPDDQRHVLAGADQPVALAAMHHRDRVRALDLTERRPDRVGEIALIGLLDEVGERLGVGLGRQSMAAASRPSRSSRKFSMIPLWMTVISPVQSWCG